MAIWRNMNVGTAVSCRRRYRGGENRMKPWCSFKRWFYRLTNIIEARYPRVCRPPAVQRRPTPAAAHAWHGKPRVKQRQCLNATQAPQTICMPRSHVHGRRRWGGVVVGGRGGGGAGGVGWAGMPQHARTLVRFKTVGDRANVTAARPNASDLPRPPACTNHAHSRPRSTRRYAEMPIANRWCQCAR